MRDQERSSGFEGPAAADAAGTEASREGVRSTRDFRSAVTTLQSRKLQSLGTGSSRDGAPKLACYDRRMAVKTQATGPSGFDRSRHSTPSLSPHATWLTSEPSDVNPRRQ